MTGMLPAFRELSLAVGDLLWHLPLGLSPDLAVVVIGLGWSSLFLWLRTVSMSGELRQRTRQDLQTLKSLRSTAKEQSDQDTIARLDRTELQVRLQLLVAELRTAMWFALPIAATTVWCDARLECQPLVKNELVTVTAYFPLASIDRPAHLVPDNEVECESGWIARVEIDPDDRTRARAQWLLRPTSDASNGERRLLLRHAGETTSVAIRWGDAYYPSPTQSSTIPIIRGVEVSLRPYRFLGLLPWSLAFILIAFAAGQVESQFLSPRRTLNKSAATALRPDRPAAELVPARDEP